MIMEHFPLAPFTDPHRHRRVSEIIRQCSSNKDDIRKIALFGLDLQSAVNVLDIGCGFGFMAKVVAERLPPHGRIVGVDACAQNEPAFLAAVRSRDRRAEFHCQLIDAQLPWSSESFDLILASYSLYFFPQILPELARVLKPHGTLVAITHSESSFVQLCTATGMTRSDAPIFHLIRRFSAENGEALLARCFADTTRIEYRNRLVFQPEQLDELVEYACFKLPLMMRASSKTSFDEAAASALISKQLKSSGVFFIEKDDAVFRARKSKCR